LNYREIKGNFGAICISELTQTNHLQVLCKVQFYISGNFLYTRTTVVMPHHSSWHSSYCNEANLVIIYILDRTRHGSIYIKNHNKQNNYMNKTESGIISW